MARIMRIMIFFPTEVMYRYHVRPNPKSKLCLNNQPVSCNLLTYYTSNQKRENITNVIILKLYVAVPQNNFSYYRSSNIDHPGRR